MKDIAIGNVSHLFSMDNPKAFRKNQQELSKIKYTVLALEVVQYPNSAHIQAVYDKDSPTQHIAAPQPIKHYAVPIFRLPRLGL